MTTTQVDRAELAALERKLDGIASNATGIAKEAQSLGIGDWQMYGLFVSPVACGILAIVDASHSGAFSGLGEVNSAVAENMTSTVQAYEATEKANTDNSQNISSALEGGAV